MKKIIGTMITFYILLIFSPLINGLIFQKVIGGNVSESFLYPIYWGLIVLSGIIVGCTCIIIEEVRSLKRELKDRKDSEKDDDKAV